MPLLFWHGFPSRLDAVNSKRVNVAGGQAAAYLQRLLQLKYPGHLAAITLSRMEELLNEHSYAAVDYQEGAVGGSVFMSREWISSVVTPSFLCHAIKS